ncbi:hypothetical protein THAOC_26319, partial [Thalassiosira oceanica]
MFFHYSEVRSVHPDDLRIGDEVEFTVGSGVERRGRGGGGGGGGGGEKLAAYNVVTLPPGSIVWEVEEEPAGTRVTGTVESSAKEGRGESSQRGQPRRLSKGDVVEFTVVTERRTKRKHARNISLLQSQAVEDPGAERGGEDARGGVPRGGKGDEGPSRLGLRGVDVEVRGGLLPHLP